MNAPQLETNETIIIDGLIIDTATGEVLGEEKPEFRVTDESSAEWVLEKIMTAEADAARERIRLKAVTDRLQSNIRTAENRAAFFRERYAADLEEFARQRLEGAKTKTLKLTWGSLSLRTVKGGLRVEDPDAALAWAKQNAPDAVKVTEAFQISKLTPDQKSALEASPPAGFVVTGDAEKFDVKTGVNS